MKWQDKDPAHWKMDTAMSSEILETTRSHRPEAHNFNSHGDKKISLIYEDVFCFSIPNVPS
jgi:hypothetical protein